ncbi:PLP-dependent aminotransferase family protein [Neptuniibacter sp. PT34_22]|uniref:aminotransferase-like domain-containing protein n=1 Tax=Neptuniibacter sp. PT34_22 TaxID=3398205 RepID=UPI0039F4CEC2
MDFLYQNLEQALADSIKNGDLPAGSKLPSIRVQCEQQGLSKATVIHAYQRLEAAGLIESRFKSGFYVCSLPKAHPTPSRPELSVAPQLVDMSDLIRDIMERNAAFDIFPQEQGYMDMPVGITELNRSIGRALRRQKCNDHQYYDEPSGLLELREHLSERYRRTGCHFSAADVTITAGCQHALSLALQLSCEPGDIVAVESPGFYGVLQLIESMGLKVLEIPVSSHTGMSTEALEQALEEWEIKACIVTPSFATPSGALMSVSAREHLLSLASKHDFVVVEDDIYGDLAFGQRISPLKSMDRENRVILCGSYSKSVSRELRLGWIIAAEQKQLMRLKMVNLLALNKFTQQGLVDFLKEGAYEKHLKKQKMLLQQQRDQLIQLLSQEWGELGVIRVSQPQGGLTLWVELEDSYDLTSVYLKARSEGILITPGHLFTAQNQYRNCLRLSFAHAWNEARRDALIRLAYLIKQTQTDEGTE